MSLIKPNAFTLPKPDNYNAPIASLFYTDSHFAYQNSRIARILDGHVLISYDLGSSWTQASDISDAAEFASHGYTEQITVMNEAHDKAYISVDQGHNFLHFQLPERVYPAKLTIISFDVSFKHPERLIVRVAGDKLHDFLAVTQDSGKTWKYYDEKKFLSCYFFEGGQSVDTVLIFKYEKCVKNRRLITGAYYTTDIHEPLKSIEGTPDYYSLYGCGDCLIANDIDSGELYISCDGIHFSKLEFPRNLEPSLTDSTLRLGRLPLVFTPYNIREGSKRAKIGINFFSDIGAFGNLFTFENPHEPKLLLKNVATLNSESADFLSINAKEGIFMANIVVNPEGTRYQNEDPIHRTLITHDGCNHWEPLLGPDGAEIRLHFDNLYFYSHDRDHPSGTISSACHKKTHLFSAYSTELDDENPIHSYLTSDSGRSWSEINDDPSKHVDQIGVKVKVLDSLENEREIDDGCDYGFVDHIKYSFDKGCTWKKYDFGFEALLYRTSRYATGSDEMYNLTLFRLNEGYKNIYRDGTMCGITFTFKHEKSHDHKKVP